MSGMLTLRKVAHRSFIFSSIVLSLTLLLPSCHSNSNNEASTTANAPKQVANVNQAVYENIRTNSAAADSLFANAGAPNAGDELCEVTMYRMSFNTIGGAGEATTSSGVFMLPHGDDPNCSGPRPVVLYAHGTDTNKDYDLSKLITSQPAAPNPASSEALLLLAVYASNGYAVIAPNYAGYADSTLSYHPYLDEVQQSTEMIDALNHIRTHASTLGAELSSTLFVTGVSQGGYVAMATHKALQAQGENVTASLPISGPYATLDFLDKIMAGFVNGGATIFAPMYINALEKAHDIYTDPSEVYDAQYASIAEDILPRIGGFATAGLPAAALFSGTPPAGANPAGFNDDHLLSNDFRTAYLADAITNPTDPVMNIRKLVKEADLRNWAPQVPMLMCGAGNDPVVYHTNSNLMATFLETNGGLLSAGLVMNLDLTDTPPAGPFAVIQSAWQQAAVPLEAIHGQTGVFCSLAGKSFFDSLLVQ